MRRKTYPLFIAPEAFDNLLDLLDQRDSILSRLPHGNASQEELHAVCSSIASIMSEARNNQWLVFNSCLEDGCDPDKITFYLKPADRNRISKLLLKNKQLLDKYLKNPEKWGYKSSLFRDANEVYKQIGVILADKNLGIRVGAVSKEDKEDEDERCKNHLLPL